MGGAYENGVVHVGGAGIVFAPYLLLDSLAVRAEHLEFILTVSMEMIVQGFPADDAPHPRFAILPAEKDYIALESKTLFGRRRSARKCQVVPLRVPWHAAAAKSGDRMDVHLDASA